MNDLIVLGPWHPEAPDGNFVRRAVRGRLNMCVWPDGWGAGIVSSDLEAQGPETGQAGQDAADKWARDRGHVLLDAAPGSLFRVLTPWREQGYSWVCGVAHDPDGCIIRVAKTSGGGWWVFPSTVGGSKSVAHGPQIGEEGKRYALAAAHALGLTGGGQ